MCRPLLRLCRPFMIYEGCLDSNPEYYLSKLARYRLSHPSLITFPLGRFVVLYNHELSSTCVPSIKLILNHRELKRTIVTIVDVVFTTQMQNFIFKMTCMIFFSKLMDRWLNALTHNEQRKLAPHSHTNTVTLPPLWSRPSSFSQLKYR